MSLPVFLPMTSSLVTPADVKVCWLSSTPWFFPQTLSAHASEGCQPKRGILGSRFTLHRCYLHRYSHRMTSTQCTQPAVTRPLSCLASPILNLGKAPLPLHTSSPTPPDLFPPAHSSPLLFSPAPVNSSPLPFSSAEKDWRSHATRCRTVYPTTPVDPQSVCPRQWTD